MTITEFMTGAHKACDEQFARAEAAAGEWGRVATDFAAFRGGLEQHLAMEDDVLFPAFEDATGMSEGGPSQTMRAEHVQMRALLEQLGDAIASRDEDAYLGLADTLLVLMQQHNLKEEGMMYPMLDAALADRVDELLAGCRALEAA